ncbi:MAG: glycosyltransferase [Bacteroidetes bacterium]|nr:glycosyltransferase [Bacteroidota bacterium]
MNIIIVGTAYPLRGGIAHHTALLYRHLSKRHTVRVVTFKRQYPAMLFPGKTQLETDDMIRIPTEPLLDSMNPVNWISVAKRIKSRNPDLIIFTYSLPFFGPCYGTVARIAKRGAKSKVLYLCHNIIPHERRPGDIAFTRYALGAGDYFIVQSDTVENDLKLLLPNVIYKKVHHPVYSIFGEPVEKQRARKQLGITDERILLCFGYVRPYKGLHVMIDAMPKVIDKLKIKLLVVGEFYDNKEHYISHIRRLGLEHHVTVDSDYVPNDKVALYFSAADIVMLPYTSATQSGIAQIAYNFNKPVIATNVGGLAEVVKDGVTGFVVEPNDPDTLAEAILRFYNESRENEFAANVQVEKKNYSWEAMTNAIEALMNQNRA